MGLSFNYGDAAFVMASRPVFTSVFASFGRKTAYPETLLWLAGVRHGD
jgi:hypothetical protein